MQGVVECLSKQLNLHLSADNALLDFMRCPEVGFDISEDHKIISFPYWWPKMENETKGLKRKSVDLISKRVREEAIIWMLPQDILTEVISWVRLEEKLMCRLVNKSLCELIDSRCLKQIIDDIKPADLDLSLWPKAEGIKLSRLDCWEPKLLEMVQQLPTTITELDLDNPPERCWPDHIVDLTLEVNELKTSPDAFQKLTSLNISLRSCITQLDLSQAIHLTSLHIWQNFDETFIDPATLPHPEKHHTWSRE